MADTNWKEVTDFFNGVIEDAEEDVPNLGIENSLKIAVYSRDYDQTLTVTVPGRKVEDFMKNLPMFDAEVHRGTFELVDWRDKR